jgi:hypothetical protein
LLKFPFRVVTPNCFSTGFSSASLVCFRFRSSLESSTFRGWGWICRNFQFMYIIRSSSGAIADSCSSRARKWRRSRETSVRISSYRRSSSGESFRLSISAFRSAGGIEGKIHDRADPDASVSKHGKHFFPSEGVRLAFFLNRKDRCPPGRRSIQKTQVFIGCHDSGHLVKRVRIGFLEAF